MKLSRLNQRGVSALETLLAVIILAILAGAGYYVYRANTKATDTLNTASNTAQSPTLRRSTANWTAYSSQAGQFSLKYPKTWVQAQDPSLCSSGMLLLGPDKASVGHCGSEDFGQISVVSTAGDNRADYDISKSPDYKDIKTKDVTVSKVQGKRIEATAIDVAANPNDSSQALATGYPAGTKVVKYLFFTNNRTYEATYVQKVSGAGSTNVLADFDLMITKTLKFQ